MANSVSSYETYTLYQGQSDTGYRLTFSQARRFISVVANGGVVWMKPWYVGESPTALPVTSPVPSDGTAVSRWIRAQDAQQITWGNQNASGFQIVGAPTIQYLDLYFEAVADVIAVGQ